MAQLVECPTLGHDLRVVRPSPVPSGSTLHGESARDPLPPSAAPLCLPAKKGCPRKEREPSFGTGALSVYGGSALLLPLFPLGEIIPLLILGLADQCLPSDL